MDLKCVACQADLPVTRFSMTGVIMDKTGKLLQTWCDHKAAALCPKCREVTIVNRRIWRAARDRELTRIRKNHRAHVDLMYQWLRAFLSPGGSVAAVGKVRV